MLLFIFFCLLIFAGAMVLMIKENNECINDPLRYVSKQVEEPFTCQVKGVHYTITKYGVETLNIPKYEEALTLNATIGDVIGSCRAFSNSVIGNGSC